MKTRTETARKWGPILAQVTDLEVTADESAFAFFAPAYDLKLNVEGQSFALLVRNSLGLTTIAAAERLQREHALACPEIDTWVLAVPRMTAALASMAKTMKVNWIDEDGNADIQTDRIRVKIRGERASKTGPTERVTLTYVSRRVGRALLATDVFPRRQMVVASEILAHNTQVSRSYKELEQAKVITPGMRGVPAKLHRWRLLELLRDDAETDAPIWMHGTLTGACDQDLAREIAKRIETRRDAAYAVTGTAAARRLVGLPGDSAAISVYVTLNCPRPQELGFELDDAGPVRICATEDVSRLLGVKRIDGVNCVAPSMAYLDLRPEELLENFAQSLMMLAVGREERNYLAHGMVPK